MVVEGAGSYEDANTGCSARAGDGGGSEEAVFHELFQKELTPSDVGKLNRLVIPKKYAVRYFPTIQISSVAEEGRVVGDISGEGEGAEGMMLNFKDRAGQRWEFRYCYWRSSQSFVFTRGWNKFVKAKELSPRDTVVFYRCKDCGSAGQPFCMIDVLTSRDVEDDDVGCSAAGEFGRRLGLEVAVDGKVVEEEEAVVMEEERKHQLKKGFKLFGVYVWVDDGRRNVAQVLI